MATINIDVDSAGGVTIGVEHVDGPDCKKLTSAIEEAVGKTTKVVKTADFNKKPLIKKNVS